MATNENDRLDDEAPETEFDAMIREAEKNERESERNAAEAMVGAATQLAERHRWRVEKLVAVLLYEVRERMQDAAVEDAEFMSQYGTWRHDNPDAECG